MPAPLFATLRTFDAGPTGATFSEGAWEFAEDAEQGDPIRTITPVGGSGHRYSLLVGEGMYQLSSDGGASVTLQRGDSGSPTAGVPEAFTVRITDKWGTTFDVGTSCNVLEAGGGDVDPLIGDAEFAITDAYTNGQLVGTVPLENVPTGTPSYAITAGNTNDAFAINSTTRGITVADETELVAENDYTLTVTATPGGDTATIIIPVQDSTAEFLVDTLPIQNDSGSTASGQPIILPIGFAAGVVPSTHELELRKSDGTTAFTAQQIDLVNTWDVDGSLGHCVITASQEDNIAGSGTDTVKVYAVPTGTGAASNTSAHAIADIRALNYTVEWVAGGTTYVFNSQDAIDDGQYRITKIGPALIEARIWGRFENAGTPHTYMFGLLWVGLRADGTTSYAVAKCINNWNNNYSSRQRNDIDGVTELTLKKNGSTAKTWTGSQDVKALVGAWLVESDVTEIWSANPCTIRVIQDHEAQGRALLIPYIEASAAVESAISDPTAQNYVPYNRFNLPPDLDAGGGAVHIGPLMAWCAQGAIKQTPLTLRKSRINAAASACIEKNAYSTTYGEVTVSRSQTYGAIVGNNAVTIFTGGTNFISQLGNAPSIIAKFNHSHYPASGTYAFINTGRSWWLEEMIVDANVGLLATNDSARAVTHSNGDSQTSVTIPAGGPRTFAWELRDLGNLKRIMPDDHPLHDYIDDVHIDQIDYLNSIMKPANHLAQAQALGVPPQFLNKVSPGLSSQWFMFGYIGIVTGLEVLRGHMSISDAWATVAMTKCVFGAGVDGCMARHPEYVMNFTHQNGTGRANSDYAQSWADVGCGDNTPTTWDDSSKLIPSTGCPVSGFEVGHVEGTKPQPYGGGHTYPAIFHAAGEVWRQAGLAYAETLSDYYRDEEVSQAPTASDWATAPQWLIREFV